MDKQEDQACRPKHHFVTQKWIFAILGISLSPRRSILYKMYNACILFLLLTYPIFALLPNTKRQNDFDTFANDIICMGGFSVATIKYVALQLKITKVKTILDTLEKGDFLSHFEYRQPVETIWIEDCINFTRKQIYILSTLGMLTVIINVTVTYITQKGKENYALAFGTLSILPKYFSHEIVCCYQGIMFCIVCIAFVIIDILYANIVSHICVQFKILQNFIKSMVKISRKNMKKDCKLSAKFAPDEIKWKYLLEMIKQAVLFHLAILDVSKQTEDMFNFLVLTEFTSMSISYCCLMYQVSQYSMLGFHFIKYILMCMTSMFPLFVMSYWGNEVIVDSQATASVCYEVDWLGVDVRFQKGLTLIMLRSQRPVTLTLGKFASLSLVTLMLFCRAYYSYYMLLRHMAR